MHFARLNISHIAIAAAGAIAVTAGAAQAVTEASSVANTEFQKGAAGDHERFTQRQIMPHGRIGITLGTIDEALAGHLGLDPNEVVLITNVVEGGGADEAGLKKHDIIVAVDGKQPVTPQVLRDVVRSHEPGEHFEMEIIRAGERKTVDVTVQPIEMKPRRERWLDINDQAQDVLILPPLPPGLWLDDVDAQALAEQFMGLIGEEEIKQMQEQAREWTERARIDIDELLTDFRERVELEFPARFRERVELPARFRDGVERSEEVVKQLRTDIEREIRSLLEETEPIEEKLEQLLDGIEERIRRMLDESRPWFGLSQQMQIIEDEDGGKSIVVRPRRGGFGGGGVGVPPRDRMEAEQPRRRQIGGGGGGVMPRERPQRDQAAERLDRLEQRLDRIERMLEQLMER